MTSIVTIEMARSYLAGKALTFAEAVALWRGLKKADDLSMARRVIERLRRSEGLIDDLPPDIGIRQKLAQQEALLTSKDCELSATLRHDQALRILSREFGKLDDPTLTQSQETLGIGGGILKRRFDDLGQVEDLRRAARLSRSKKPRIGRSTSYTR